ncbi:MAG TPA: NAD(P)-dependent alcohol dehydrogenase [Myxococcales bacterium]|jgi:uncharacterized zinc-type alcohol dehydrogenase-like protein
MGERTEWALAQAASGEPLAAIRIDAESALGDGEVDIAVDHCSVCHSDVHLLDGDWGEVQRPLVPGHEVVGRVVRKGREVPLAEGAVVGLGWQAGACGACAACRSSREHLCSGGKVRTCVNRPGGFAERVRCSAKFCFEIPAGLDPRTAAPLLCAGLTVFSPLSRLGAARGKRVGVVGFGGLGHLAVSFASALGAEVLAFDVDLSKRDLARQVGARELIDSRGALPANAVDLLLVTTHAVLPWTQWMSVLDLEGTLCLVGVPGAPLTVAVEPLMDEQKRVTGSVIGSPATMREMLAFAARHRIEPIVERMPMSAANEAVLRVRRGQARMRIVLDAPPHAG